MKNLNDEQLQILKNEGYEFIKNEEKNRILIKHLLCGKVYSTRIYGFFKEGKRCTCQRKKGNSKISTTEDFQNFLNKKFNLEYEILTPFINRKSKIKIKHIPCNFEYEITAEYLMENRNKSGQCPICKSHSKNSIERMNFLFNTMNLNIEIDPSETYENGKRKFLIHNKDCGHTFLKNYLDILKTKSCQCPICQEKYRKDINIDFVKNEILKIDSEYEVLSKEYRDTHSHLTIFHKKCMRAYNVSRTNFLSGKRCPYCSAVSTTSNEEKEILKFLNSYSCNFKKERFIREDHSYFEIDAFSKEKNIGVEFDGLYWHSETKKGKNAHIKKTQYFKEKGIRIVHIFSDEWQFKQNIIKDKIKSILGVQKEKIYARKCSIREIDSRKRNQFLEINHIQGADGATISLGLFNNNELIAVMSFCKLRKSLGQKSKEGIYELSRFAGKLNFTIVGGFSKLLKYAIKNYPIKEIITYADLRFTSYENNVYDKNGFILDHISKPSYFYLDKNYKQRLHRFNFRKQELNKKFPQFYSKDKSESEIMKEAGYDRIWDCGNLVYKMIIN